MSNYELVFPDSI